MTPRVPRNGLEPRRMDGACYRVTFTSKAQPVLTWEPIGEIPLPRRRQTVTVAAFDEKDAAGRAAAVGAELMGGQPVRIDRVEMRHRPHAHNDDGLQTLPTVTWRSLVAA